jgi:hypothetical protein
VLKALWHTALGSFPRPKTWHELPMRMEQRLVRASSLPDVGHRRFSTRDLLQKSKPRWSFLRHQGIYCPAFPNIRGSKGTGSLARKTAKPTISGRARFKDPGCGLVDNAHCLKPRKSVTQTAGLKCYLNCRLLTEPQIVIVVQLLGRPFPRRVAVVSSLTAIPWRASRAANTPGPGPGWPSR